MPGRKPKPTQLKLVAGNPGKRALPKKEPKAQKAIDLMPPLNLSEAARAHWHQVALQLSAAGILTELDCHALALYCEAFARWVSATQKLRVDGLVITSESGYACQSPYLPIANKAFDQMLKLMAEFGMTPSSRSRVEVPEKPPGAGADSAWGRITGKRA